MKSLCFIRSRRVSCARWSILRSGGSNLRLQRGTGSEINLRLSDHAVDFLLELGTDHRYGARHLKRVLARYLVFPFSSFIDSQQMGSAGTLNVGLDRSNTHI